MAAPDTGGSSHSRSRSAPCSSGASQIRSVRRKQDRESHSVTSAGRAITRDPPFWTAAHPSASCVQTALQRMICAYRSSPLCTRGAATRGRARWRTRCLRDPSWRCGLASGVPRRRAVAAGQPRLPSTRGAQVDAHPVLCCLGLRYPPARRLDEGPADGGVLVHVRPRAAARDLASAERVRRVERSDRVAPGMLARLAASARRSPELALPQCPQVHATTHPARPAITERGPAGDKTAL